jgi:hypothetical protein
MSNEQQVVIPVDLFNALTNYLTTRPYNEVHQIVEELRQSVRLVESPDQEETESDAE